MKKPTKIQDEVFGELNLRKGFISAKCAFKPLNLKIFCILRTYDNNPSPEQRLFFQSIVQNYTELRQKLIPVMLDTFKESKQDFEINDFDKEFTLISISLPIINNESVVWEICFSSIHDYNHTFTIIVKDFEPENGVVIDG